MGRSPKDSDSFYDTKLKQLAPAWEAQLYDSGTVYDIFNAIMTCESISHTKEYQNEYQRRTRENKRAKAAIASK